MLRYTLAYPLPHSCRRLSNMCVGLDFTAHKEVQQSFLALLVPAANNL